MLVYRYLAKDAQGVRIQGVIEADNQAAALDALRRKDLTVISLQEHKMPEYQLKSARVSLDDLAIFSRQLATMIDSGITLAQSLDILAQQTDKKDFAGIIGKLRQEVEEGVSLSDALNKFPNVFSNLFVNMVKAGESSGLLNEILDRLASYLEKTSVLQRKIKSSLVYPAVVSFMAIAITAVLLFKVIPTFKGIFASLGGKLPFPTQVLISVSDTLVRYWYILIIVIAGLVFMIFSAAKTEKGRKQIDQLSLKLPVFGDLFRKVAVSKFTRTLSTLVKSGIPILAALDIVSKTSGNKVIEGAINSARESVKEGETIAKPLAQSGVFPAMVTRMISVGEQSGELEKMLTKIANFYDEQVDAAVSSMTSLIEPLIIVFLGVVIGGIVIALFMPIFKITELIAK